MLIRLLLAYFQYKVLLIAVCPTVCKHHQLVLVSRGGVDLIFGTFLSLQKLQTSLHPHAETCSSCNQILFWGELKTNYVGKLSAHSVLSVLVYEEVCRDSCGLMLCGVMLICFSENV